MKFSILALLSVAGVAIAKPFPDTRRVRIFPIPSIHYTISQQFQYLPFVLVLVSMDYADCAE